MERGMIPMSNSPLVSYTLKSPNHSGKRNHEIIYFTPHCVVGQCSIESLGNIFVNPSRQASSNYGIDKDGRVGLFVDECNRAWTSSSSWNDNRAITVECASDSSAPWAFRSVVYERLVDLLVDCCKRNGKNKVLWLGNYNATVNYQPKSNEMVLTVHRWYAATCCPGDWMFARMGQLADDANKKLSTPPAPDPSVKTTVYDGVDYKLVYDPDYYYNNYVDLQKAYGKNYTLLIQHFVKYGMAEGRQGITDFNVWTYRYLNDDLNKAYGDDLKQYYLHYMRRGYKENRYHDDKYFAPVFNAEFYARKYPDIKTAFGADKNKLLRHFVKYGMNEGRQACSSFIVQVYKANYKDLRDAFGDNLPKYYLHYIDHGQAEHREAVKKIR